MKSMRAMAAAAALAAFGGSAVAAVTDINGMRVIERRFNDFSDSSLVTTSSYPSVLSFEETYNADRTGFANQHVGFFSADGGATDYAFQNNEGFDISFDIRLETNASSPRKEAGFRFDTLIAGEAFFFVTSDGEVAAFGGFFPFHSFGTSAYTLGTTANLRIVYTPGDGVAGGAEATIEYFYNGVGSGPKVVGNVEDGVINGTIGGVYGQFQNGGGTDFANVYFSDFRVVPAPATGLALLGLAALRRRR